MRFARIRRAAVFAVGMSALALVPLDSRATALAAARSNRDEGFLVVVNEQNVVASAPRILVSRFFLKKASHWDSGAVALPVDLPADSPVREAFTRRVLAKSVSSIKAYWQQQIFSGREIPPPEKAGEAEVLEFVKSNPAAIAYVSPNATLPRGVRVLTVTD
jgi:ABC-type phosphate transport system substrate-binding protein